MIMLGVHKKSTLFGAVFHYICPLERDHQGTISDSFRVHSPISSQYSESHNRSGQAGVVQTRRSQIIAWYHLPLELHNFSMETQDKNGTSEFVFSWPEETGPRERQGYV